MNEGDQVLRKVITEMRLSRGAVLLSLYKTLFNKTMAYIVTLPEEVAKSELVATKLGELTTNLYGMESALYFTTGLIDWYDRQDIELESAIVKVKKSTKINFISFHCVVIAVVLLGSDFKGESDVQGHHRSAERARIALVQ